jgi:hypothetical protein
MKKITSFADDLLDLLKFAKQLESFLDVERSYVSGSLVVSLNAPFGAGKTAFLEMWKDEIETRQSDDKPRVILLNAWEGDFLGQPLFSIVSSIERAIGAGDPNVRSVVSAAKSIGWFMTAVGGQVVTRATGVDLAAAAEFVEGRDAGQSLEAVDNAYSIYKKRAAALESLKKAVKDCAAQGDGQRIVFLIDELDRCRPDFAISYLETIKHVFDVEGLTFILAVDREQLASVARAEFGDGLNFSEYYRKFVQREVSLPPISATSFPRLADAYVKHYLHVEEKRLSRFHPDWATNGRIISLVCGLRLTPRQIQEAFRIVGHLCATANPRAVGGLPSLLSCAALAMACIRVGDIATYHAIGRGEIDPVTALTFLTKVTPDPVWWWTLLLTGGGIQVGESIPLISVMEVCGINKTLNKEQKQAEVDRMNWGIHSSKHPLRGIYWNIEEVVQL